MLLSELRNGCAGEIRGETRPNDGCTVGQGWGTKWRSSDRRGHDADGTEIEETRRQTIYF